MTIPFLRGLTGKNRTRTSNRRLGLVLTFVAGAANAGGFLAVHQYTSHMTGVISQMADHLALQQMGLVLAGLGSLISFMSGAACSAILFNWARRKQLHSKYALALLLEALLLLVFGVLGASLSRQMFLFVPLTVMLLCFIMGLQNAIITKISNAEIRTTHVTGLVTDLGIELGKLFYWNIDPQAADQPPVRADRERLWLLMALLYMFFIGGVAGALGFKYIGFLTTVPLAALLMLMAVVPVMDDVVYMLTKRSPKMGTGA
jgi:uncharacterized membrane protein YoaK (UPF0700 family)